MKAVDHQTDVAAIHFLDNFFRELERLYTAISLAQELKSERHAIPFSNRSQLSEHVHRLFDYFVAAHVRWEFARDDDNVWTSNCRRDRTQLFALGPDFCVSRRVSKRGMFDRIDTQRL